MQVGAGPSASKSVRRMICPFMALVADAHYIIKFEFISSTHHDLSVLLVDPAGILCFMGRKVVHYIGHVRVDIYVH